MNRGKALLWLGLIASVLIGAFFVVLTYVIHLGAGLYNVVMLRDTMPSAQPIREFWAEHTASVRKHWRSMHGQDDPTK